jgi:phage tail-like protein
LGTVRPDPPLRNHPYAQFNFLVDLGDGMTAGPAAGFAECSQIAMSVDVIEYRHGNDTDDSTRKLPGRARVRDVTLKRGAIGSLNLNRWLDQTRNGDQAAVRNVTIQLQNEDRTEIAMTWKLRNARIVKHTSGPLNAKGTDVAIEELTLAYEGLEIA